VRVDILERLADIIRPLIALDASRHQGEVPAGAAEANGFRVTVEMTSLLGTAGEDFASILTSLGYRVRRTPKVAAPVETPVEAPAETPTPATVDAVDAAVSDAAQAAVEGSAGPEAETAEAIETAVVEAAAADLGGLPPTEAEAEAPAAAPTAATDSKPAEPEFDEVWFPGGRRPDNQRSDNRNQRPNKREGGEGEAAGNERPPRRFQRPDNANGKPKDRPRDDGKPFEARGNPGGRPSGKPAGKPGGGKRFDRPKEDWKEHRPREKRETVIDPNSPWAALAALRQPKSD
jgi:ATP-dependent RNA helicase SUPV3L1/SUV3